MARYKSRNGKWQVEIRKGKYKHNPIYATFTKKTVAQRWAVRVESDIAEGVFVDGRDARGYLMSSLIERYMVEVTMTKADSTIASEKNRLRYLSEDIGHYTLDTLTWQVVFGYFTALQSGHHHRCKKGTGISASTLRKRLQDLSNVLEVADKIWELPMANGNPAKDVKAKLSKMGRLSGSDLERTGRLKDGEYDLIRKYQPFRSDSIFKYAALFLIETGMRRSEMVGMRVSQIDWDHSIYSLERQKSDRTRTQHKRGRDVPLTRRARAILRLVIWARKSTDKVWPWTTPDSVTHGVRNMFKKLGIEGVRVHDLRHEFGSYHTDRQVDFRLVAAAMGHVDLKSMKRYSHPDAKKVAGMFERD